MQKLYGWAFIILFAFLLCGCLTSQIVSVEKFAKGWIGESLIELKKVMFHPNSYASRIGWKETTYPLENGNFIYVDPVRKDCFIRWEVNPDNVIVDYKTEGNRCF